MTAADLNSGVLVLHRVRMRRGYLQWSPLWEAIAEGTFCGRPVSYSAVHRRPAAAREAAMQWLRRFPHQLHTPHFAPTVYRSRAAERRAAVFGQQVSATKVALEQWRRSTRSLGEAVRAEHQRMFEAVVESLRARLEIKTSEAALHGLTHFRPPVPSPLLVYDERETFLYGGDETPSMFFRLQAPLIRPPRCTIIGGTDVV
jgi:hypothetical protein